MQSAFRFLIAGLLVFSQITYAADATPPLPYEARDPGKDLMASTQSEALKKGPKCDKRLLDELNTHIFLDACIKNWDANCSQSLYNYGKYVKTFAKTGGVAGMGISTNLIGQALGHTVDGHPEILKKFIEDGRYAAEIEKHSELYRKAMDPEALKLYTEEGKVLNADKVRAAALKKLEQAASAESKAFSKSVGKLRSVIAKKAMAETLKRYGIYAAAGGGVLSVGLIAFDAIASADPTAGPCQDNGAAYIDYVPNKADPKKCDFSFSLTGGRVRSFMSLKEEDQVKFLQNNPATCEYYYYMNEHLKGEVIPQVLAMQNVEFTKVPTCNKVDCPPEKPTCDQKEVKGVEYEVKVDGQAFNIATRTDPVSKKTRNVTLKRLQDGNEFDTTDISFEDAEGGSRPFRVNKKYVKASTWGEQQQVDFTDYAQNTNDPRVQNTVNLLTKNQIWGPLVATCCAENDAKKCIKDKLQLPGLVKSDAPSELQPVTKTPAGATSGEATPGTK